MTWEVDDEMLADFADAVLNVARKLALTGPDKREIVPLTGTEVDVVREVIRVPGTNPTQIAAATGLRRSNVSAAVRVLELRQLLVREQHADDARFVRLTATPFAVENVERIRALWVGRLRDLPEPLLRAAEAMSSQLTALDAELARSATTPVAVAAEGTRSRSPHG